MLNADAASFVPTQDARAIAGHIVGALVGRPAALQRAARARQGVVPLSLDATVTRYEEVYRRVVAARATATRRREPSARKS
jgi:hypothetical protein